MSECTKLGHPGTCLQALAGGWITASDLCARCTRVFMSALDSATGAAERLSWHPAYTGRAELVDEPAAEPVSVDDDIADTWIALPGGGTRFLGEREVDR